MTMNDPMTINDEQRQIKLLIAQTIWNFQPMPEASFDEIVPPSRNALRYAACVDQAQRILDELENNGYAVGSFR